MVLSKRAVDEFRTLYKRTYGVILSDAEARIKANDLMNVYRGIYARDERSGEDLNESIEESE